MSNRTLINGRTWILLNHWEDQWHFVALDQTMQGEIVSAKNFQEAVEALKAIVE